jgi:hypothetical protein
MYLGIEVHPMNEIILQTSTLPEPLSRMIRADRVRARETGGVVSLTPIVEGKDGCPLLGIAADCGFTVDEFLARMREDKELEGE